MLALSFLLGCDRPTPTHLAPINFAPPPLSLQVTTYQTSSMYDVSVVERRPVCSLASDISEWLHDHPKTKIVAAFCTTRTTVFPGPSDCVSCLNVNNDSIVFITTSN